LLANIKRIFWDLKDPIARFNLAAAIWCNYPGKAGEQIRRSIYKKYFAHAGEGFIIHQGVRVRNVHKVIVGDFSELGVDCFLQGGGGIVLGKHVLLGPSTKIWSVNHTIDDLEKPIKEQGYAFEEVRIDDGCWLGANVFVFPGVHLPEGCVVSAGSVVGKKKYPPYSIIAGYPARVIGNRRPKEKEDQ